MKYELLKILKDPRLCLLLAVVIVLNSVLFYQFCTDDSDGYTMAQIKEAYQNLDGLEQEQEKLREEVRSLSWDESAEARRRELYLRIDMNNAVLDRVKPVQDYHENRKNIISESEIKLRLGLFGDSDSFSGKSMKRGIEAYKALEHLQLRPVFLGGAEVLTGFALTDGLMLLFSVVASLTLLTQEKESGLQLLTRPTKLGRTWSYFRRFWAGIALVSAGFVLLYGSNFLISGYLFGFEKLSSPLQSLYGYSNCHLMLTVQDFLIQIFSMKYLWSLTCLAVIFFICNATSASWEAVSSIAGCVSVSFLMETSDSLLLRNLSLTQLSNMGYGYQGAVYLDILGNPIEQGCFAFIFMTVLSAVSFGTGFLVFRNTQQLTQVKRRKPIFKVGIHTNLFLHECFKALAMWKGIPILLAFLVVQVWTYSQYPANNSEFEYYYRGYSQILEGLPDENKDLYLDEESMRFVSLNEQLAEYALQYPDQISYEKNTRNIRLQLRAEEAFHHAFQQYLNLRQGQSYLYQTGYSKLFGRNAMQDDILNLVKAYLVLALLLSPFFVSERETGIQSLQIPSKKRRQALASKIIILFSYGLIVVLIAFLPKQLAVESIYGSMDLTAQANSILNLTTVSDFWSVGRICIVLWVIRYLLCIAAAGIICLISKKAPSLTICMLLSASVLLIPLAVTYTVFMD